MQQATIAQLSIEQALMELPPKKLLGLDLIKHHQSKTGDQSLPDSTDLRIRIKAMQEMREYAEECVLVTTRLQNLGPCPTTSPLVEDFAL